MDVPSLPDDQFRPPASDVNPSSLTMGNVSMTPELFNLLIQMHAAGQLAARPPELITRGSWNQAEDEMLTNAVHQLGPKKWTDIAKFVSTRTSKQCRERWYNRLSPEVKHEPFEPWEDEIIIDRQRELGNRWSMIARHLPGRSTNSIKNRWYSGLKSQHEPIAKIQFGLEHLGAPHMGDQMGGSGGLGYRDPSSVASDL
jgi:hypothetical protein